MDIYLDANATEPLRPEARAAMIAALDATGNASSVHRFGRLARRAVDCFLAQRWGNRELVVVDDGEMSDNRRVVEL